VEDIKFSPDCTMAAFGAHGGQPNIQILNIKDKKISSRGIIKA
jgi:hypothetical protein